MLGGVRRETLQCGVILGGPNSLTSKRVLTRVCLVFLSESVYARVR